MNRRTVELCQACGRPLPAPPVLCAACGHDYVNHNVTRTGAVTWCSRIDQRGRCPCPGYVRDAKRNAIRMRGSDA